MNYGDQRMLYTITWLINACVVERRQLVSDAASQTLSTEI